MSILITLLILAWLTANVSLCNKIGKDAILLSDDDKHDAVKALKKLEGTSSLTEAVEFFIEHTNPKGGKRTVAEVIEEYIAEAERDNLRSDSIQDMKNRLGRLGDAFGGTPISALTRRHYTTVAGGLFNYAINQGYTSVNPFTTNSKRRKRNGGLRDETLPEIITVALCPVLMFRDDNLVD